MKCSVGLKVRSWKLSPRIHLPHILHKLGVRILLLLSSFITLGSSWLFIIRGRLATPPHFDCFLLLLVYPHMK